MTVEISMLALGVWLYAQATRPRDRIGRYVFLIYVVLLLALFIGDRFGTDPATVNEIIWPGIIAEVVLLVIPAWFDRHRTPDFTQTV